MSNLLCKICELLYKIKSAWHFCYASKIPYCGPCIQTVSFPISHHAKFQEVLPMENCWQYFRICIWMSTWQKKFKFQKEEKFGILKPIVMHPMEKCMVQNRKPFYRTQFMYWSPVDKEVWLWVIWNGEYLEWWNIDLEYLTSTANITSSVLYWPNDAYACKKEKKKNLKDLNYKCTNVNWYSFANLDINLLIYSNFLSIQISQCGIGGSIRAVNCFFTHITQWSTLSCRLCIILFNKSLVAS